MAIDPKANDRFKAARAANFSVGAQVRVNGVDFIIVSNDGNKLTLQPKTAKISGQLPEEEGSDKSNP